MKIEVSKTYTAEIVIRTANEWPSEEEVKAACLSIRPDWDWDGDVQMDSHEEVLLEDVDIPFYDHAARRVVDPDEDVDRHVYGERPSPIEPQEDELDITTGKELEGN